MERESIAVGDDLRLRPFVVEDVPWVYEVSLDPMLQKYVQVPLPYRREDAAYFVREVAIGGWDSGERAEFVVERGGVRLGRVALWLTSGVAGRPVGAGSPVGTTSTASSAVGGTANIGYWTDPAARGAGVATAAVRAVCGWGFGRLGLDLVEWRAEVGNVASRRVAEKAGFRVEAVLRRRLVHRGVRVDAWVGSLLPEDLRTVGDTPGFGRSGGVRGA